MEGLALLGRVLFSAFSNVFQKKLTHHGFHPFFIVFVSYLVLTGISLPLLRLVPVSVQATEFWINIFLAALLDMAATLFLVMSLSKTDLSVFGPLNAYKVVISMLLAMLFLGETPSIQGFAGVAVIVTGSYFLFPARANKGRMLALFAEKGVQFRFLSIALFSLGTIPLKTAVISGGALTTTVFWCLFGLPLAGLVQWLFVRDNFRKDWQRSRTQLSSFIFLGALIFFMQYLTMLIFSQLLIAYSLALFQLGMILQVFLGYRIFQEKHILRRLLACLVMIAGSLLVLNAS